MKLFIKAAEVADLLGFSSDLHFKRNRLRLEEEHEFPVPLPTSLRPLLWRRSEVQSWIDRQGTPKAAEVMAPEDILNMGSNISMLREAARP